MKALSDWQSARVRDALRAYHRYERGAEGEYFTWKDVREAIAEYTDFEIGSSAKNGAERLRQFVEGLEDKDNLGLRKYSAPKADAVEAIIDFLTHEEIDLLNPSELEEHIPGPQAVLRLTEYFAQDCDLEQNIDASVLEGPYAGIQNYPGYDIRYRLLFQRADGNALFQIIERRIVQDTTAEAFDKLEGRPRKERISSLQQFAGWGVITPEDTLLLFLKEKDTGRNHSYQSIQDIGLWLEAWKRTGYTTEIGLGRLIFFLLHDYGIELSEGELILDWEGIKTIINEIRNDKLISLVPWDNNFKFI